MTASCGGHWRSTRTVRPSFFVSALDAAMSSIRYNVGVSAATPKRARSQSCSFSPGWWQEGHPATKTLTSFTLFSTEGWPFKCCAYYAHDELGWVGIRLEIQKVLPGLTWDFFTERDPCYHPTNTVRPVKGETQKTRSTPMHNKG